MKYVRPEIVVSGVVTALIIGAVVYWMRNSGSEAIQSFADAVK